MGVCPSDGLHTSCQESEPLLFLRIWFRLTNFFTYFSVTIRNDHRAYVNATYHFTFIVLPQCRVKDEQVKFCKNSHYSTYFLVKKDVIVIDISFSLRILMHTDPFWRDDILLTLLKHFSAKQCTCTSPW